MKFKLDENLGARTAVLIRIRGHDVATVREEGLADCGDDPLFRICAAENRCLLTLDLDFSEVIRFRPSTSAGVAILRIPRNPTIHLLERMIGGCSMRWSRVRSPDNPSKCGRCGACQRR